MTYLTRMMKKDNKKYKDITIKVNLSCDQRFEDGGLDEVTQKLVSDISNAITKRVKKSNGGFYILKPDHKVNLDSIIIDVFPK